MGFNAFHNNKFLFFPQLRWLPFTIPKFSEKKVDFVAVSLVIPLAQG